MSSSPAQRELSPTDIDRVIIVVQAAKLNVGRLFLISEHGLGGPVEVIQH